MSRNKDQQTIFKCRYCGKALPDGRKDRTTCNDRCRKAFSRAMAQRRATLHRIERDLVVIREMLFIKETYDEALKALKDISAYAENTYQRGLRQKDLVR